MYNLKFNKSEILFILVTLFHLNIGCATRAKYGVGDPSSITDPHLHNDPKWHKHTKEPNNNEGLVPIYRTESAANPRFDCDGYVINGNNDMLYISIDNLDRTKVFCEQSIRRERPKLEVKMKEMVGPHYFDDIFENQLMDRLISALESDVHASDIDNDMDCFYGEFLVDCLNYKSYVDDNISKVNGQDILCGTISYRLANKIMESSITLGAVGKCNKDKKECHNRIKALMTTNGAEELLSTFKIFHRDNHIAASELSRIIKYIDEISNKNPLLLSKDSDKQLIDSLRELKGILTKMQVHNVDVTKSHNQFGISGDILEKFKKEINASGGMNRMGRYENGKYHH